MSVKYETLGDVADELQLMLADGVSLGSIEYILDRVYWEAYEARARTEKALKSLGVTK